MNVAVSLDGVGYNHKPVGKEIGIISERIGGRKVQLDIKEIADQVGIHGQTFCPAVFTNGKRKSENFDSLQLFVLDFDGKITYDEVKSRAAEYNLPIAFSYKTFNWTEQTPRFRVVFCHIVPINEIGLARMMLDMLVKIFAEVDTSSRDVAKMYFGGKGLLELYEDNVFRVDLLAASFERFMHCQNKNQLVRDMRGFAEAHNIGLLKHGFLDYDTYVTGVNDSDEGSSVEKTGKNIQYYISIPQISTKVVFYRKTTDLHQVNMSRPDSDSFYSSRTHSRYRKLEKVDDNKICSVCRLYKEFVSGTYLSHDDRFLLATNVRHISGGRVRFLKVIDKYYGSRAKWEYEFRWMDSRDYSPKLCDRACPYTDECDHAKSLYLKLTGRRRITKKENGEHFESLEICYGRLKAALEEAMKAQDMDIHLIPGQTGLGKTRAYVEYLQHTDIPAVIAVPTVKLKNEVAKRLGDRCVEVLSLQELHMPFEMAERIQVLYGRGLYLEVRKELKAYMKQLPDGVEKQKYELYLDLSKGRYGSDSHIVITHARLLRLNECEIEVLKENRRTLIIDEDILFTILRNTKSVAINDIRNAITANLFAGDAKQALQEIVDMPEGAYKKLHFGSIFAGEYISKEVQDSNGIRGNINELLQAGSCYRENGQILYFVPSPLPGNKVVVLSATLDKNMYECYFRDRKIQLHEVPKARYRGRVIQYSYYSMSRKDMKKLIGRVGGISKFVQILSGLATGKDYIISFKSYDEDFASELHFGNAIGIDAYRGMNVMLVGTPHLPESRYKLIAIYLGLTLEKRDAELYHRKVQYKGYEFPMMSYKDRRLRSIQLYMINSELEQCIGRSRPLREEVSVYVFSNFPCEQAELKQNDYLAEYLTDAGGEEADEADTTEEMYEKAESESEI